MSTGTQLKIFGKELAAAKHAESLKAAQFVAQLLGKQQSTVSINDVRRWIKGLHNASGSVFAGEEWVAVGFEQVTHEAGRARIVRTWRLRNGH